MNTKLMISALRQGKTGEQILSILDAITSDAGDSLPLDVAGVTIMPTHEVDGITYLPVMAQYVPTLEEIAF